MEIRTIDELISYLTEIRNAEGNLTIMTEYEACYSIGCEIKVTEEFNPESNFKDLEKIKVLFIS